MPNLALYPIYVTGLVALSGMALLWWLRRDYVPRTEVEMRFSAAQKERDGIGARAEALQTLYLQSRERIDVHERDIRDLRTQQERDTRELRAAQERQWQDIAERVVAPLDRMSARMGDMSELQATLATTVEHVCEWLRSTEFPPPPPRAPARGRKSAA